MHNPFSFLLVFFGFWLIPVIGIPQSNFEDIDKAKFITQLEFELRNLSNQSALPNDEIKAISHGFGWEFVKNELYPLQIRYCNLNLNIGLVQNNFETVISQLTQGLQIQMDSTGKYVPAEILFDDEQGFIEDIELFAWGHYYERKGELVKAAELFKKCVPLKNFNDHPRSNEALNKHLLMVLRGIGDFSGAEKACRSRVQSIVERSPEDYFILGECMNDLAMIYIDQEKYDLVDVYLDSSIVLRKLLPEDGKHGPLGNAYDSKGSYHLKRKDYTNALANFELSKNHFSAVAAFSYNPDMQICYANIGLCQMQLGNLLEAENSYKTSLEWIHKTKGAHPQFTSHIYLQLAELNLLLGKLELSRIWLNRVEDEIALLGYSTNVLSIRIEMIRALISLEDEKIEYQEGIKLLNNLISKHTLEELNPISLLIELHSLRLDLIQRIDKKSIHLILNDALELDSMVTQHLYGLSNAGNVNISKEYRLFISSLLSRIRSEQEQLDPIAWKKVIKLVESSKSSLFHKYAFEHQMRISKSNLTSQFEELLNEIAIVERQLNTLGDIPSKQLKKRLKLLELYERRNEILDQTNWKIHSEPLLPEGNCLHYFMGDSLAYLIESIDSKHGISSLGTIHELENLLREYQEVLISGSAHEYDKIAIQLGSKLLHGVKKESLNIYPDGLIDLVPFDALLFSHRDEAKFWNMDYMLFHTRFSYPSSISFSPQNAPSSVLIDQESLPQSTREKDVIETLFKGFVLSSKSELKNLLATEPKINILHLSVHGKHDPINPLESYLLIPEISGRVDTLKGSEFLSFPTVGCLATLAACESGMGSIMANEEKLSLSSFFQAAGFANTITSLWKANDHSTSSILTDFYNRTHAGEEMYSALHQSKINFFTQNKSSHASPLYWAHLKLDGNGESIPVNRNSYLGYLLLILVIPAYFILRRISRA